MVHPLTTNTAKRGLKGERYSTYQEQLHLATPTVIELAFLLQEAAGVSISELAPLYINQATLFAERDGVRTEPIQLLNRITMEVS